MAEQFLTLMADLDEQSQKIMSDWYSELCKAGFTGTQTPDLPFHISLASFSLDKETEVVEEMQRLANEHAAIPVHISHIGIFAGGKVLFGAPDINPELVSLHDAIHTENNDQYTWTPHATILIDEPSIICDALPVFIKSFRPFLAKITRLHLCAFWPKREIATVELRGIRRKRIFP